MEIFLTRSQRGHIRAVIWNTKRRLKKIKSVKWQNTLWWRLKRHLNHVEYFYIGEQEYRFDGTNLERVL
jgi:hypothetical protein